MLFVFTGLILLLGSAPSYAALPVNSLIPNGDIESGIWGGGAYSRTNPSRTRTAEVSHSARHSLKVNGAGYFHGYFLTGYIEVQAGTQYNVSMHAKTEGISSGATLAVHWYRGTTWLAWRPAVGGKAAGTTDWRVLAGEVTAPAGATNARVQIRVESIGGSAWIDDVAMVDPSSSPSPLPPAEITAPAPAIPAPSAGSPVVTTSSTQATQYKRWEASLTSPKTYANPFSDVTLRVQYTGPAGQMLQGFGFWDGGNVFKLRMSFPEAGTWHYTTSSSDTADSGLHNVAGVVQVQARASTETNPLYQHGPLRISADKRNLEHADGTPFLWVGDTLWGATVWLTEAGFNDAIADRRAKHVAVLQTNFARKAEVDTNGETPWSGDRWNVNFMQKVDRMFDGANDQGMYLFVNGLVDLLRDRGIKDYRRLIEMIAIRYAAHHVSFASSMDDPFDPLHREINQRVLGVTPHQLLSQHPGSALDGSGNVTTAERYYDDPTEHYVMEATGVEGDIEQASKHAIEWTLRLYRHQPPKPVVNGEAWYEGLRGGTAQMTAHLGYLTLLSGGSGYTYGTDLWNAKDADLHAWKNKEGATYMRFLYDFFKSVDNGRALVPMHHLIRDPAPEYQDRQVLASTRDGRHYIVYMPNGGAVTVDLNALAASALAISWYDPLTGTSTNDAARGGGGVQMFDSPLGGAMVVLKISAID
ncbi:MAG: DUF4038 domain-containing protein [Candidatus Rokuibacteriota bacterium]